MDDPERGIGELWDEPWEGLDDDEDAGWSWDEVDRQENGKTQNPPRHRGKWKRWYITYHKPTCTNIKISADKDPETGKWFNPHPSSGQE
jgi:hypothetical protein